MRRTPIVLYLLLAAPIAHAQDRLPDPIHVDFHSPNADRWVRLSVHDRGATIEVAGCEDDVREHGCTRTRGFVLRGEAAAALRRAFASASAEACRASPPSSADLARVAWDNPAITYDFWLGAATGGCARWALFIAPIVAGWERNPGR